MNLRIAFIFLANLFICQVGYAQQIAWDSVRVPDVYATQVELFKANPPTSRDIVILGNSITFWGDWNFLLNRQRVKNQGIPGDTSFGVIRRIEEAVRGRPSAIFILIGINDLGRNIPDSIIVRNHERIVRYIQTHSPKTKIYLQSLLPTNPTFDKVKHLYHKEENVAYINQQLKAIAERAGAIWVDLHPHFSDEKGYLKKEYTWDGVHLTLAGYQKWAEVLREKKLVKGGK